MLRRRVQMGMQMSPQDAALAGGAVGGMALVTGAVAAPFAINAALSNPVAVAEGVAAVGEVIAPGAGLATGGAAASRAWTEINATNKAGQMVRRGWDAVSVGEATVDNIGTGTTINRATGNPATAYFVSENQYVVIDNVTVDLVQVSNRNDPRWFHDMDIVLPPI